MSCLAHEGFDLHPPTVAGLAVLLLAVLAIYVAATRFLPSLSTAREAERALARRGFVAFSAVVAANTAFGFDSLLAAGSRCLLVSGGAYGTHGAAQLVITALAIGAAIFGYGLLRRRFGPELQDAGIALGVAAALGLFLFLRALSLHEIDAVLNLRLFGVSVSRAAEIGLLALFIAAMLRTSGPRSS